MRMTEQEQQILEKLDKSKFLWGRQMIALSDHIPEWLQIDSYYDALEKFSGKKEIVIDYYIKNINETLRGEIFRAYGYQDTFPITVSTLYQIIFSPKLKAKNVVGEVLSDIEKRKFLAALLKLLRFKKLLYEDLSHTINSSEIEVDNQEIIDDNTSMKSFKWIKEIIALEDLFNELTREMIDPECTYQSFKGVFTQRPIDNLSKINWIGTLGSLSYFLNALINRGVINGGKHWNRAQALFLCNGHNVSADTMSSSLSRFNSKGVKDYDKTDYKKIDIILNSVFLNPS